MDPELEQLIARLFSVAGSKGLSATKSIALVLEAPSTYENVQVIVSHTEPYTVTAPLNIVWLVADTQSSNYGKPLKRQARVASATYNHSWTEVTTKNDIYTPTQVWDIPRPSNQDFIDHINSVDNPHRTSATDMGALPLSGGSMTGALFVRTDTIPDNFNDNEAVPKSWVLAIKATIEQRFGGFSQGLSYVINQLNLLKARVTTVETKVNTNHGPRIDALEAYRDTLGFTYNQETEAPTWNINHSLNSTHVIVQVYDINNNMVLPARIKIVDENNVDVIFANSITGSVKIQPVALSI